jgi:hypothetical protein
VVRLTKRSILPPRRLRMADQPAWQSNVRTNPSERIYERLSEQEKDEVLTEFARMQREDQVQAKPKKPSPPPKS